MKSKVAALMHAVRQAPSLPAVGSLPCCLLTQTGKLHSGTSHWGWDTFRVLLLLRIEVSHQLA